MCARLSPDRSNAMVAYGGNDANIYVLPFYGNTAQARLEGSQAAVSAVAFDTTQSSIVGGNELGGLKLWDVGTEKVVSTFSRGHKGAVSSIDVRAAGNYAATASDDKTLRVWDMRRGASTQSYRTSDAALTCVSFSPNGLWIASGSASGKVCLYNLQTAKLESELCLHTGAVTSIQFHPERYYAAVGSADGTVSLWNIDTFKHEFQSSPCGTAVDSVGFCGNRMFAVSPGRLKLYDLLRLSDKTAAEVPAAWGVVRDAGYSSFLEEIWYVESDATSAVNGRLAIDEVDGATTAPVAPPRAAPAVPVSNYARTGGQGALGAARRAVVASPPRRVPPKRGGSPQGTTMATGTDGLQQEPFRTGPAFFSTAKPADARQSPSDAVRAAVSCSPAMRSLLSQRLAMVKDFRTQYAQQPKDAIARVRTLVCDDQVEAGFVFDFLQAMQHQRMKEKIPIGAVADMCDILGTALQASDPQVLHAAVRMLRSLNTKFRARVEEAQRRARNSQSNGRADDPLGAESATALCRLREAGAWVQPLAEREDAIGREARSLLSELPQAPQ